MFKARARTVARSVRVEGKGLHSGEPCAVELRPAAEGGLRWRGAFGTCPVHVSRVDAPGGSTRFPGVVDTPEHLLAALVGLGITDCELWVEGPEVPGLDGSALPWVHAIEPVDTGWTRGLRVGVTAGEGFSTAPAHELVLAVEVDFGPAARGALELVPTPERFASELAWARTFLPHAQLEAVRAAGRGLGVRPGEVVVLGPRGPLVPVRGPDEAVRHKMLDLLGDLALFGAPVTGRFEVRHGTHARHHALVRAASP